MVVGDMIEW